MAFLKYGDAVRVGTGTQNFRILYEDGRIFVVGPGVRVEVSDEQEAQKTIRELQSPKAS